MKIVAVTGGSGSGKSTILDSIRGHFADRVSVLSLDDYYRSSEEIGVDENGQTNYDLPEAINHLDLLCDIDRLQNGHAVTINRCMYNRTDIKSKESVVPPADWLIIDGLFVMHHESVRKKVDITVYVDATPPTRFARRKKRDQVARGYTSTEIEYQWNHHVRPSDIMFIEPWRKKCDIMIDNERHHSKGVADLIALMELTASDME